MEALVNRIKKNYKHLRKWAARNEISCYRIYDHDIPEYPFCVDIYGDDLHISEYFFYSRLSDEDYEEWMQSCIESIAEILDISGDRIFLKRRKRMDHKSQQYEKVDKAQVTRIVNECGLQFKVNLSDYLDTGLFLDHRPLRQEVRATAAGKSVLNLFAYTGSFSVYAAAGDAAQVTTVDLSNTYLNWAKENLELNNLYDASKHQFIAIDTMAFLKETPTQLYDMVIVDPPSFSNSRKFKGVWDVQRDHPTMLYHLLKHVKPGGVVYFSNNFRNFEPDFSRLGATSTEDISLKTIPEDFRNKRIHVCYKIIK